jgi:hypothetical protein
VALQVVLEANRPSVRFLTQDGPQALQLAHRRGLPVDPQLRYRRHGRGFPKKVCLKRDYFPHERSQDHGVILRGTVPLSAFSLVWRGLNPSRSSSSPGRSLP